MPSSGTLWGIIIKRLCSSIRMRKRLFKVFWGVLLLLEEMVISRERAHMRTIMSAGGSFLLCHCHIQSVVYLLFISFSVWFGRSYKTQKAFSHARSRCARAKGREKMLFCWCSMGIFSLFEWLRRTTKEGWLSSIARSVTLLVNKGLIKWLEEWDGENNW